MLVQPRAVSSCIINASQGIVACPSGVFSRCSASVCLIATAYVRQAKSMRMLAHDTHIDDFTTRIGLGPQANNAERPSPEQLLALPLGILICVRLYSWSGEPELPAVIIVPRFLAPFFGPGVLFLCISCPASSFLHVCGFFDDRDVQSVANDHCRGLVVKVSSLVDHKPQ